MRSFPACYGDNCFFELIKSWFLYKGDIEVPEVSLFLATSVFDFQYQMDKKPGDLIPSIQAVQKYERMGLKSLGVNLVEHRTTSWEEEWEAHKQFLSQGEVPIVWIAGSGLPGVAKSLPPTYLAVRGLDVAKGEVQVTCVYYHGSLSTLEYKKLRSQLSEYGEQPNRWLALTLQGIPHVGNASVWQDILRQRVSGKELVLQAGQGLRRFANDLENALTLPPIYLKILVRSLHMHLWHPWGLPSVRKQLLHVLREVHASQELLEAFSLVDRDWRIVQRMFGKALVSDTKSIMERVVERLNLLAELEATAYRSLEQEFGGEER